jgi:GNAT superfamily N-acetyltransferase
MIINIRLARLEDVPAILQIYAQPDFDNGKILTQKEAEKIFLKQQQYPDYEVFVAEIDNEIIGTFALLIMENMAHQGTSSAIVEDVGVLPNFQNQGIGKQMMEFAMQKAKEKGCYKLVLSSNLKRQKAHQFYESLGFCKHGFSFLVEL